MWELGSGKTHIQKRKKVERGLGLAYAEVSGVSFPTRVGRADVA